MLHAAFIDILPLKTLNYRLDDLVVVIEIVHCEVDPLNVRDLISHLLANGQAKLLHIVARKVNVSDLWHVEEGQYFVLVIISDSVVA